MQKRKIKKRIYWLGAVDDVLEPVLCKGVPSKNDFEALDKLANTIVEKHKDHGFK